MFYTDEIEVVNPLGAKRGKHKLLAVYCSLLNLHVKHRSKLESIYLILLVRYVYVKKYGLSNVLQPLLEDLNKLYAEGHTIGLEGQETRATVIVFGFCGDNLSLNRLGGFTYCFSRGRVCRFCMVSVKHLPEKTCEIMCQPRILRSHQSHLEAIAVNPANRTLYGVNEVSPLLQLPYFDITRQLPPDIMHDILEGGIDCILRHVLKSLLSSGLLCKQNLEELSSFKYGANDLKNKPPPINPAFINSKSVLMGTAATKWCLIRFFPLIFGARVPKENEDWELLLKFREIVDIVFASEMTSARLVYLEMLVQTFLNEPTDRYGPGAVTPKLHFMVHYARFVREVGPLRHFWSMRFEAKHQSLKKLAACVKNFRNLTYTLAKRHQLRQSYQLRTFQLYQELKTSSSKPVDWNALPACAKEVLPTTVVHDVKSATLDRRRYKCGCVLVSTGAEWPEFYKIESLLVANGVLHIVATTLEVQHFDRHRYCYCVKTTNEQKIYEPSEKFEHCLLDLYKSGILVPKWETLL